VWSKPILLCKHKRLAYSAISIGREMCRWVVGCVRMFLKSHPFICRLKSDAPHIIIIPSSSYADGKWSCL
jgi:hypothetical protein